MLSINSIRNVLCNGTRYDCCNSVTQETAAEMCLTKEKHWFHGKISWHLDKNISVFQIEQRHSTAQEVLQKYNWNYLISMGKADRNNFLLSYGETLDESSCSCSVRGMSWQEKKNRLKFCLASGYGASLGYMEY